MVRRLVMVVSVLALAFLAFPGQAAMSLDEGASRGAGGWSSGWVTVTPGTTATLTHNLGGDPLLYSTQLWFRDLDNGLGINNRAYGGNEVGGNYSGAAWRKLTAADVDVFRFGQDDAADELRMWVWIPEDPPDYCSLWTPIAAGGSQVFTHNLGGNPDDYVVGLWFQGPDPYGINQQYFGGMEDQLSNYGAWWHNLTGSTVAVSRAADDMVAPNVRVCITVADPPGYDSGWQDIPQGGLRQLSHALGGQVDNYVVRMEFKDADLAGLGVHLQNIGGNASGSLRLGAAWQNLTAGTITVYRFLTDENIDQVRIRIWQRTKTSYLPLVVR